jgi:hypothetical protein
MTSLSPSGVARLLRAAIAFVWLWTGLAVLHPEYRRLGAESLARLGLPPELMYLTCAGEVLLGLWVALRPATTAVTLLQAILIIGFTALLSLSQPELWFHPFGPLTKNVPLLALLAAAWRLERPTEPGPEGGKAP